MSSDGRKSDRRAGRRAVFRSCSKEIAPESERVAPSSSQGGHIARGGRANVGSRADVPAETRRGRVSPTGFGWAARPGVARAGDSRSLSPRSLAQRRRDERSRLRCSCAALRQVQRGFFIDDKPAARRRSPGVEQSGRRRDGERSAGVGVHNSTPPTVDRFPLAVESTRRTCVEPDKRPPLPSSHA